MQEEINWRSTACIDCLSTFCRAEASIRSDAHKIRNPRFMDEAYLIRNVQSQYCRIRDR